MVHILSQFQCKELSLGTPSPPRLRVSEPDFTVSLSLCFIRPLYKKTTRNNLIILIISSLLIHTWESSCHPRVETTAFYYYVSSCSRARRQVRAARAIKAQPCVGASSPSPRKRIHNESLKKNKKNPSSEESVRRDCFMTRNITAVHVYTALYRF